MKRNIYNPYLPSYEYVPDGEPHVFGDRVYIYGSHDRFGGKVYCENDYVCWSAPIYDLSDWKYEGIIYKKIQDPENRNGKHQMYAPDVVYGIDGRYYLYYGLDFMNRIAVAVCDSPAGKYEFYGEVHYKDGTAYGKRKKEKFRFDPGVLADEDGRIWLYTGFCPQRKYMQLGLGLIGVHCDAVGNQVVELEQDMVTVKSEPRTLIPGASASRGTGFEGHEFYEASSIRKFNGKYYFIYSSVLSHELVYAVSDFPDKDFVFGGILHSNANIGFNGETEALYYWGNNHGSVEKIDGKYYVFGHRQTNQNEQCRQGIAEQIGMGRDGRFEMAEMTSAGLNGGILPEHGSFEAGIACVLYGKKGACKTVMPKRERILHPYITQQGADREDSPRQYITNISDGTVIGYKYFYIAEKRKILSLVVSKAGKQEVHGKFIVSIKRTFSDILAEIVVEAVNKERTAVIRIDLPEGKHPLYFKYIGSGRINLWEFSLEAEKEGERYGYKESIIENDN